jgi:hypothetical protein
VKIDMKKIKIPSHVTEEIYKCLLAGEKKPKRFWQKYRGVGNRAMGAIMQFGVVDRDPLPKLAHLARAKNILFWRGYETAQEIKNGIESGKIFNGAFLGYGAKSHRDVCSALI